MNKVLHVGLLPSVVDLSAWPGMTEASLAAGLKAQEDHLCSLGFDARWILVDRGETAAAVVEERLRSQTYDVILVGAGVRVAPAHFDLFEKLINVIHEHAPRSRLCFNTKPGDTTEAVLRWIAAPAPQG